MDILFVITVLILIMLTLTLVYKKRPYTDKNGSFTFFPKYRTEIILPIAVFQERYPTDILDKYLTPRGFSLSKGSHFPFEYSRGSRLGDFSSKYLGVVLRFNEPYYYNKCMVTIEAKWMVFFDAGELYEILQAIKNDMERASAPIWEEGPVDTAKEHIIIKVDESSEVLACIGFESGMIYVEFKTDLPPELSEYMDEVKKQLDFYFGEKEEKNPWEYAIYHCSTSANIYSPVKWIHIKY